MITIDNKENSFIIYDDNMEYDNIDDNVASAHY